MGNKTQRREAKAQAAQADVVELPTAQDTVTPTPDKMTQEEKLAFVQAFLADESTGAMVKGAVLAQVQGDEEAHKGVELVRNRAVNGMVQGALPSSEGILTGPQIEEALRWGIKRKDHYSLSGRAKVDEGLKLIEEGISEMSGGVNDLHHYPNASGEKFTVSIRPIKVKVEKPSAIEGKTDDDLSEDKATEDKAPDAQADTEDKAQASEAQADADEDKGTV